MITRRRLDAKCNSCGAEMVRVWSLTYWLDDYADECSNELCHNFDTAETILAAWAREVAEREGGRQ